MATTISEKKKTNKLNQCALSFNIPLSTCQVSLMLLLYVFSNGRIPILHVYNYRWIDGGQTYSPLQRNTGRGLLTRGPGGPVSLHWHAHIYDL